MFLWLGRDWLGRFWRLRRLGILGHCGWRGALFLGGPAASTAASAAAASASASAGLVGLLLLRFLRLLRHRFGLCI